MNADRFPLRQVSPKPLPNTRFVRRTTRALFRVGLFAALLVVGLSAQAVDIFMRIGGAPATIGNNQTAPLLPGESTDPQYPSWNYVLGMSHGITLPVTVPIGGGTTVGTNQHAEVNLTKLTDRSTPSLNLLVNGVATGLPVSLPIDYVTIDFRDGISGGSSSGIVFYRMVLENVYVTSVQVSGGTGSAPAESINLKYERIRWTFVPYAGGKAGTAVTKGWDLIKNGPY